MSQVRPDAGMPASISNDRSPSDVVLARRSRLSSWIARYAIWVGVAALIVIASAVSPVFLTTPNAVAVLQAMAILGIVAVGQTLVIASGGMDLSVGMLMGLVVVITNGVMADDPTLAVPMVVLGLVMGAVLGAATGSLLVVTRIHPLILTFGVLSILQGVIFLYTDRSIGGAPENYQQIAYGSIGPVPIPSAILLILALGAWILLNRTVFGRHLMATGAGEEQARRAGIPVNRIKIAVYSLSGLTAGLAGIVLGARLGVGSPLAGSSFGLDAIVAVVLGGTAFTGGHGNIFGTLAGVLLLAIVANVLNLLGVSSFTQQVIKGLVVVAAVALYARTRSAAW